MGKLTGTFKSSDILLNRIWDACGQTLLCCMEDASVRYSMPEQNNRFGDGRSAALSAQRIFNEKDFSQYGMKFPAFSPGHWSINEITTPNAMQSAIPAWSFLWVREVWEFFWYSGNREKLQELYSVVSKMLGLYWRKYLEPDTGLFVSSESGCNFFDWAGMDCLHRCVAGSNILLCEAFRIAGLMGGELGLDSESLSWQERADELKEQINRYFWSKTHQAYIDSIHDDGTPSSIVSMPTNTLALLYQIAPTHLRSGVLSVAHGDITQNIAPFSSPFALFYLLELLGAEGQFRKQLEVIRKNWRTMSEGKTTTPGASGPVYIISEFILGVHWLEPGGRKIRIRPQFSLLDKVEAIVPTLHGSISVKWQKINDFVTIIIDSPGVVEVYFAMANDIDCYRVQINEQTVLCPPQPGELLLSDKHVEIKLNMR